MLRHPLSSVAFFFGKVPQPICLIRPLPVLHLMCAKALVTLHCPRCVVPVGGPLPFVVPRGPPACPVRDGAVTGAGWVLAYSLVEQDGVPCWAVTFFPVSRLGCMNWEGVRDRSRNIGWERLLFHNFCNFHKIFHIFFGFHNISA